MLCPVGATAPSCIADADGATAGWQGSLTVHVTASGAPVTSGNVTFTLGATTLGAGPVALDGSGNATVTGITLPEGSNTIVATTDSIPNAGVGSGSLTVTVDLTAPNAPSGLNALVLDRRATSMQLTWTAPSDAGGGNVTGYQVRYAKVAIDASNFDNASVTTAVPYAGTPATAGQLDGISVSGLYIENGYYFAVQASDGAGNRSAIVASASSGSCTCLGQCCAAHFNVSVFPSTSGTNEELGYSLSAGGDLNGDGLSDILAGTFQGGKAYIFFGSSTVTPAAPSVVFSAGVAGFGNSVAQIGDVDGDGLPDIAISDPINALKVYIYKGRTNWPMALTDAQADYVVGGDATYTGSSPRHLARGNRGLHRRWCGRLRDWCARVRNISRPSRHHSRQVERLRKRDAARHDQFDCDRRRRRTRKAILRLPRGRARALLLSHERNDPCRLLTGPDLERDIQHGSRLRVPRPDRHRRHNQYRLS